MSDIVAGAASFNLFLLASSPLFSFDPSRDGPAESTWNASYTGMTAWPHNSDTTISNPTGRRYTRTQASSAAMELEFHGTGVLLCFAPNGAEYRVSVDGGSTQAPVTGDAVPAACGEEATEAVVATGLRDENHRVLLAVAAARDREFQFYGGQITLGISGERGNSDVRLDTIDDQDKSWKLIGTELFPWNTSFGGRTLFNTTHTFSCGYQDNMTMSRTFTGAGGVVLYGNIWRDAHDFSVILDGEPVRNMDASSAWEDGQSVFFAQGGLEVNTAHTVTIINYNANFPTCFWGDLDPGDDFRFCCTGIDALQLLHAVAPSSPTVSSPSSTATSPAPTDPKSSGPSLVGAIVGGVVGGLIGLVLLGLLVFCLLRRQRRRAKARPKSILAEAFSPKEEWMSPSSPTAASAPEIGYFNPYSLTREPGSPQTNSPTLVSTVGPPTHSSGSHVEANAEPTTGGGSPAPRPLPPVPGRLPLATPAGPDASEVGADGRVGTPVRMAEEDMARILNFVASRMDTAQQPPPAAVPMNSTAGVGRTPSLPQYPGSPRRPEH